MNAIITFILSFLGINFIVFLPYWLMGLFSKINHPKKAFFDDKVYFIFKKILYKRFSDDCFRLVLELQILSVLLLVLNIENTIYFKIGFILIILITFIYMTYISVIIRIFKKEPILINDFDFAKTGLMVYKKKAPLVLTGMAICMAVLVLLSNSLVDILINSSSQIEYKWPLIIILCLSIAISLVAVKKIPYIIYYHSVSFSLINHLFQNLKKCYTLKQSLKTLNTDFPYAYSKNIHLKKQPNIVFIFLESYGSFVFSDPNYGVDFKQKMEEVYKSLNQNEFQIVSSLSESPVASGGSWLSHSSVLFGVKVSDIAAHEVIFNQTEYVSKIASIPKYLSTQGYKTTLATTISYNKSDVNWEKVKNVYPFEDLMLYHDFNYTGKSVPIFSDRYTIPDEYTLNYAYQAALNKSPFFLSVNTTNSHYNYISPIKPIKHWKDYNSIDFSLTDGLKKNSLKNFFTAINYQIDYIHDFLLNNKLDDTITVLIGDHQPPFITPENIDKSTPIHIISKNNDFINAFKEFKFTEGLVPGQKFQKHESFFSKFIYALNNAYGEDKNLELPIFEDGIKLY
jgi:phosphoglycerol transferase MdoB-like AlkP superfamily enzyme